MSTNTQAKLNGVRPPRVQITYDVETGGDVAQKTLPFVVGVIADLAPGGTQSDKRLIERKFVEIERETLDGVMASLQPKLSTTVANKINPEGGSISINMEFGSMEHFTPGHIAKNIPQIADLLEKRANLNDLLAKLEGNEKLNDLLAEVVLNSTVREAATSQALISKSETASDSDEKNKDE